MKRNLEARLAKLETGKRPDGGLLVVHREHDSEEDFARRLQKLKAERPCPPELTVVLHSLVDCPCARCQPISGGSPT
jgi:hypothetical protein